MNLKVSKKNVDKSGLNTLIVFLNTTETKGPKKNTKKSATATVSAKSVTGVKGPVKDFLLKEETVTGKNGEITLFRNCALADNKNLLVVGLGAEDACDLEGLRVLTANVVTALKANKITECGLLFDSLGKVTGNPETIARALQEAFTLSTYEFNDHKKKNEKENEKPLNEVELLLTSAAKAKSVQKGLADGKTLAEAVNFSRWLGDQPGNKMNPTILAKSAQDAAKGSKLKVTVWDKATIAKHKMGALLGVAAGSDQDPRLIIMEYKGAAASKKPICFVGKGLTFDAGGISLKPGPGMEEMKFDMCGGANVIGTLLAIARLKLKVNAIGIVPASENMPGPSAVKPGDILTAMNGTTIEVNNTDAEGRLILADALCYAVEQKPAAIVDAATLTGAMMVALGSSHTGVYSTNDKLWEKINSAAAKVGESVWRMPLCEDHTKDIKGTYADLSNIGVGREAGSATAAAFLKHFVGEEIPWAHFDIAGTAWHNGKRKAYHPKKGASGIMVRTFVELAKSY